jgi:hypothetical protein
MDNNKKYSELIILNQFRKHYPSFPKGRLFQSESPDFILKTNSGYSIGIELTSLLSPSYSINNININTLTNDLHHSILKKEEKLDNYRKNKADEYWLIVYADSIEFSSPVSEENIMHWNNNQGFNRIFLFELFGGKVWGMSPKGDK